MIIVRLQWGRYNLPRLLCDIYIGVFLANASLEAFAKSCSYPVSVKRDPTVVFFRGYGSKWLSPKLNWLMWVIPFGLIVTWMSSWSLCILCMCDIHIHIHVKSKMDTENAQHFVSQWPLQPATCQRFHKSKICSCWAPGKRRLAPLGRKTAPAIRHRCTRCRGTGHGWNLKPPFLFGGLLRFMVWGLQHFTASIKVTLFFLMFTEFRPAQAPQSSHALCQGHCTLVRVTRIQVD